MNEIRKPTVYVLAGPNGAGNTTFAAKFLPDFVDCRQFLNADLIAAGLSAFAASCLPPEGVTREEAGRLTVADAKLFSQIQPGAEGTTHER
jgi:predicted ABC-type ATPase